MQLIHIPDGTDTATALSRTTHLCISAHQDDTEIMCYNAISQCYINPNNWFTAVIMSNGAGAARNINNHQLNEQEYISLRNSEQIQASDIGKYSALYLLGYTSCEIKDKYNLDIIKNLTEIILTTRPEIIYIHNPFDKHLTHVSAALKTISALKLIKDEYKPFKLYCMEVWRGLDWLPDKYKTIFDATQNQLLAKELLMCFKSQISDGKNYYEAAVGRKCANITFGNAMLNDTMTHAEYGIDLTDIIDSNEPICDYFKKYLTLFYNDALSGINTAI